MRGKVFFHHRDALGKRITPAYAGKRKPFWYDLNQQRDHPRVCGEKWTTAGRSPPPRGSPPRMRGKVHAAQSRAALHGITPAYAGKSYPASGRRLSGWDHPRVCGEKLAGCVLAGCGSGSPPRMRGKAGRHDPDKRDQGITPAYAGKRLKKSHSTVSPVAIVPLFPSVCNRPVVSNGNPAERDAPLFLPAENTVPASPAYNLRSS